MDDGDRGGPDRLGSWVPRVIDGAMTDRGPSLESVIAASKLSEDEKRRALAGARMIGAEGAAVRVPSDEEIRSTETSIALEGRRERLHRSGIKAVLRAEDRRLILADRLDETVVALEQARAWLAVALRSPSPGRNILVLAGVPGTGKTVAAGWVIARIGGRYVTTEEYLRDYARWLTDRTREDGTNRELARYEGAGLIVLDEVGTEHDRNLMRDALHRLVDRRQTRRRQLTILITNLSRVAFVKRLFDNTYDARTRSRMDRDARIIGIEGKDMRAPLRDAEGQSR